MSGASETPETKRALRIAVHFTFNAGLSADALAALADELTARAHIRFDQKLPTFEAFS